MQPTRDLNRADLNAVVFDTTVRVIRGYDRKSRALTGVAAKASATVHDGTAKAFLYSGLFDCIDMRIEWNADNHRVCEQALLTPLHSCEIL